VKIWVWQFGIFMWFGSKFSTLSVTIKTDNTLAVLGLDAIFTTLLLQMYSNRNGLVFCRSPLCRI